MTVDQDRQLTQQARRRMIIRALSASFSRDDSTSPISRLAASLRNGQGRALIANSDVDGMTAAMMLASVSSWRISVLIDKYGYRVAPGFDLDSAMETPSSLFGVDVFSCRFPGVSNHPVYFGPNPKGNKRLLSVLGQYDQSTRNMIEHHGTINPSAWVGTAAMRDSDVPNGMPYKYPLGTAQMTLAALEGAGHGPKFFDRQYLPWLVANCDGGLDTIRSYAWNAEMWWGSLAAVVGPASLSEQVFALATNQRPADFRHADRSLRYDEPERSEALDTKWNLVDDSPRTLATFVSLLSDWTGWPDPFEGGVEALDGWQRVHPTRSRLPVVGLTKRDEDEIAAHTFGGLQGIHVGFSSFDGEVRLGWALAGDSPALAHRVPDSLVGPEESLF